MNKFDAKDIETHFLKWRSWEIETEPTDEEFWDFWHGTSEGDKITLGEFGEFEVLEAEVGKAGVITDYDSGGNTWANWIILKQGDRYFRLNGEHDSWDPKGWDGKVEEVEQVKKTIEVWETKHDY